MIDTYIMERSSASIRKKPFSEIWDNFHVTGWTSFTYLYRYQVGIHYMKSTALTH